MVNKWCFSDVLTLQFVFVLASGQQGSSQNGGPNSNYGGPPYQNSHWKWNWKETDVLVERDLSRIRVKERRKMAFKTLNHGILGNCE